MQSSAEIQNLCLLFDISTRHSMKSVPIIHKFRHKIVRCLGGATPTEMTTGIGAFAFIIFKIFAEEQKTD